MVIISGKEIEIFYLFMHLFNKDLLFARNCVRYWDDVDEYNTVSTLK